MKFDPSSSNMDDLEVMADDEINIEDIVV